MFPVGVMAADRKRDTKRPPRLLGRPFRITRWCSDGAAFGRMVGVVSQGGAAWCLGTWWCPDSLHFLGGGKYGDEASAPYFPPLTMSQRRLLRSNGIIPVQTAAGVRSAAVITEQWGVLRIFRRWGGSSVGLLLRVCFLRRRLSRGSNLFLTALR